MLWRLAIPALAGLLVTTMVQVYEACVAAVQTKFSQNFKSIRVCDHLLHDHLLHAYDAIAADKIRDLMTFIFDL